MTTVAGSTSASNRMRPQWQAPSTFTSLSVASLERLAQLLRRLFCLLARGDVTEQNGHRSAKSTARQPHPQVFWHGAEGLDYIIFGRDASMARDGRRQGNRELRGGNCPIAVGTGKPLAGSLRGVPCPSAALNAQCPERSRQPVSAARLSGGCHAPRTTASDRPPARWPLAGQAPGARYWCPQPKPRTYRTRSAATDPHDQSRNRC